MALVSDSLGSVSDPQVAAKADVVLVGAGMMSATLGALLRRLEPGW
ncbi:MAG TPA: malate:quinone oxidoreductase, partial [Mycobacterium sp.]